MQGERGGQGEEIAQARARALQRLGELNQPGLGPATERNGMGGDVGGWEVRERGVVRVGEDADQSGE